MGNFSFGIPPADLIVALTVVPFIAAVVVLGLAWAILSIIVKVQDRLYGGSR